MYAVATSMNRSAATSARWARKGASASCAASHRRYWSPTVAQQPPSNGGDPCAAPYRRLRKVQQVDQGDAFLGDEVDRQLRVRRLRRRDERQRLAVHALHQVELGERVDMDVRERLAVGRRRLRCFVVGRRGRNLAPLDQQLARG